MHLLGVLPGEVEDLDGTFRFYDLFAVEAGIAAVQFLHGGSPSSLSLPTRDRDGKGTPATGRRRPLAPSPRAAVSSCVDMCAFVA